MGTGLGFLIACVLMGAVREVLGSGSFLGISLFGPGYEGWIIMILPPGGFLTIGFILLAMNWFRRRKEGLARSEIREWPDGVAAREAA